MYFWPEYVSVDEKKKRAAKAIEKMKKKGSKLNPVVIAGRTITRTFWGKSWCSHLESYRDYENRLSRGRSYVRNNAVIDLSIKKGAIAALVSGSSVYTVDIIIKALEHEKWQALIKKCAGKIDSLVELLQGKLSKAIMEIIIQKDQGIFPQPHEITLNCSCPDYASMCKHIAAVLYGVGARLDEEPEKLFLLRQVDHLDLLGAATSSQKFVPAAHEMDEADLSSMFDIELDSGSAQKKKESSKIEKKQKNKPQAKKKQLEAKKAIKEKKTTKKQQVKKRSLPEKSKKKREKVTKKKTVTRKKRTKA